MDDGNDLFMTNCPEIEHFTETLHTDSYPFISIASSDFSGKSVLITGASKGIGRVTALSFARAGCSKIAIAARSDLISLEDEIKSVAQACNIAIPEILCLKLDVKSESSVAAAADEVSRAFGCLDVLFNNAGVLEAMVPLEEGDPAEWWQTWEVNVKSIYLMSRAMMPLLLKSETKTMINNSSSGAHMLLFMSYQTAKTAVIRLTEFLAAHYGKDGFIAISVHPGTIRTNLENLVSSEYDYIFKDSGALPADTVVWLCKTRRGWLNGRFVSVNWDMSELEAKKDDVLSRDLFKFRLTV